MTSSRVWASSTDAFECNVLGQAGSRTVILLVCVWNLTISKDMFPLNQKVGFFSPLSHDPALALPYPPASSPSTLQDTVPVSRRSARSPCFASLSGDRRHREYYVLILACLPRLQQNLIERVSFYGRGFAE